MHEVAEREGRIRDIITNNYMREHVEKRRKQDREEFLDSKINAVKPIFKNFQDNNTNILRTELGRAKVHSLRKKEREEASIQAEQQTKRSVSVVRYRCYDQDALERVKPVRAIERLLSETAGHSMNKTVSAGFAGIKRNSHNETTLLDKVRRNKEALAHTSTRDDHDSAGAKSIMSTRVDPSSLYATSRLTSSQSMASHRPLKAYAGYAKEGRQFLEPSLDISRQIYPFVL